MQASPGKISVPTKVINDTINKVIRPNRILLIIFAMLFIACSSEVAQSYSTGEEVYEARCSACHGTDFEGRVGPALDASSESASMPDSYWVQTITKGKGSMPAQRLTDNEVTMVIEYIRSNH